MTFKEAANIIREELNEFYPQYEIEAMSREIFRFLFGFTPFQLIENRETTVPEKSELQIYNIIRQLKQFRPLQYILGTTEFYGLNFKVDNGVLIPRPETEELVDWIISDNKASGILSIIDIGTGSGIIAVSLAKNLNLSNVYALDISEEALMVAQQNALLNETKVEFIHASILTPEFDKFADYDIIVSNPPYVTVEQKSEMHPNVLDHEPHVALFVPEQNPFVFYEAIARFAQMKLKPDGSLYFEINEKYPRETAEIIQKFGFKVELKRDINNKYRMLKAWRNG